MRDTQSGNVLFLILIAVALFAALSYAVTQTQRSGSNDASDETLRLDLATAEQLTQSYQVALQRMHYLNGIDPDEISFENQEWPSWLNSPTQAGNPNCTTEKCRLFSSEGGNVHYVDPIDGLGNRNYWTFTRAYLRGIGDEDTADFIVAIETTTEKCIEINEIYGIENPSGAPPNLPGNYAVFSQHHGTTPGAKASQNTFPEELRGQYAGCVNQLHSFHSGIYPWLYFVILAL